MCLSRELTGDSVITAPCNCAYNGQIAKEQEEKLKSQVLFL